MSKTKVAFKKCPGGRQLESFEANLSNNFFVWQIVCQIDSVPLVSASEYNRVRCKASVLSAKLEERKRRASDAKCSERTRRRVKQKIRAEAEQHGLSVNFEPSPQPAGSASPEEVSHVLDDNNISLRKYHKIRKCFPNAPSLYSVRRERSSQNEEIDQHIESIENASLRSIESVLKAVKPTVERNGEIRVKFSADGANVGKFKTFTNFTITFVDETDTKVRGPHLIGIVELCEQYAHVRDVLKKFDDEIRCLNDEPVVIDDLPRRVRVVFCADYKFLLISLGMKSATSAHSCIYCTCKSSTFFRGPGEPRHTIRCGDSGTKLENMLPSLSLDDIVVDVMHMYFRVSDRLFGRLVEQEVPDDAPSRTALHAALDRLGLKGHLVCKENGVLEFSSLQSRDREKLIGAVVRGDLLDNVMPQAKAARKRMVRALFAKFEKAMDIVKNCGDKDTVRQECKTFLDMFLAMYQKSLVTPYMHIMAFHVAEMVEKHGALQVFNQQAVEKENHHVTSAFFSCTNFRDGSKQIMRKAGRRLLRL